MRKKVISLQTFSCLLLIMGLFMLITPETSSAATISSVVGTEKNVSVKWNKQKKAKKYIVYRKKDNGKFVRIATVSRKKKSFLDRKVTVNKRYSYRVAGIVKGKRRLGDTRSVKITKDKEPVRIKSLVTSSASATLYWDKAQNANYYTVFRKTPKGSYRKIGTAPSSKASFTDKKIKSGVNYTYSVCAVKKRAKKVYYKGRYDNEGITVISSKPSVKCDFTTLHAEVKWDGIDDENIAGYQIRRKFVKGDSFKTIKTIDNPTARSYKDVYYDSMNAEERASNLTASNFEDPSMNSLVYTVRAYSIKNGKISYGNYNTQGIMHVEPPTITGLEFHSKEKTLYADLSFSLLKNAEIYKIYGGYVDSNQKKKWELLGTCKPKWRYGDYKKTVRTLSKYKYYTVNAGFAMNDTIVYSKYDADFTVSNRNYSDNNILFLGDSISFGSPYKGKTTVERFSYPWRVELLTGCKYFNPSIPGATYTVKYKNGVDGDHDPERSRIVTDVAEKIKDGKTPKYNTDAPISDASGKPVKENVPSYVQYENTQHFYDFDVIVMAVGTNDWQDNAAMGDINSTDITQFYGALNVMMDWITEASQYRVNQNKNPIKIIFTDLYYSDRVSGQYGKRNNRFVTKNGRGYTLKDYQKAIDDIADKYAAYGMEIWQMPTDKYCNHENAPYTMSDNLHMSRYTYGQIGNGITDYMIRNEILDKGKSKSDKDKLMTYVPFSKLETQNDSKVKDSTSERMKNEEDDTVVSDATSADNDQEKMPDEIQQKVMNQSFRQILGAGIKEQPLFLELGN